MPTKKKAVKQQVSRSKDVEDFLTYCDDVTELLEGLDDSVPAAFNFALSAMETVDGIKEWVEDHNTYTLKQREAVENIEKGVEKWNS